MAVMTDTDYLTPCACMGDQKFSIQSLLTGNVKRSSLNDCAGGLIQS